MPEELLFRAEIPIGTGYTGPLEVVEVPCPICKKIIRNFSGKIIINGVSLHIDYCKRDDVWWLNSRPVDKFYTYLYEKYFYSSPMPEQFGYASLEMDGTRRQEKAVLNMDDIEKHIDCFKKNNFLEIGCATGELLIEAKRRGWKNVLGIEIERRCCEIAREKKIRVICGSFEDAPVLDRTFDLIFADNVIEHLLEPEGAILKCNRMQEGGDYLILRLPDTPPSGPRLKLIDHTYHFTRKSITGLLDRCNYRLIDIFYSGTFYSTDKRNHIDNMTVIARKI